MLHDPIKAQAAGEEGTLKIREVNRVLTTELQQAIEALQKLPDNEQNAIAKRILDEIDEAEWNAIVSEPHVKKRLRELGRQAIQEDKAKETEEDGVDCPSSPI
jgi:hypothetical protein